MSKITAQMVKELRERTGVGMMECKKALSAENGDMEAAIASLKKAGALKAEKKGGRIAAEGLVSVKVANNLAAIIEVNSETDFAAKSDNFQNFVKEVLDYALENKMTQFSDFTGFEDKRLELVSKIGENISVRRIALVEAQENQALGYYLHGGSEFARIASIVKLDVANDELAKDLAMQIAAMKPEYLDKESVPAIRIEKEREIFLAQMKESEANANKPEDILAKIVEGKVNKFVKELTLMGQAFVKDGSQSIESLLKANKAKVLAFERFEVGEGIEKKVDNFAEEVMAQVKNS